MNHQIHINTWDSEVAMKINEIALNTAASTLAQGLSRQSNLRTQKKMVDYTQAQKQALQQMALEAQHRNLLEREAAAQQRLAQQLQTQRALEKEREAAAWQRTKYEVDARKKYWHDLTKTNQSKNDNMLKYIDNQEKYYLNMLKLGMGQGNPYYPGDKDPRSISEGYAGLRKVRELKKSYLKKKLSPEVYNQLYKDEQKQIELMGLMQFLLHGGEGKDYQQWFDNAKKSLNK